VPSRPPHYDAADCVADIIDNAGRIERYLTGVDRARFEADGLTRDAVERCVERICEAVHRLGDRAEALMPDHPWGDIRGMGNKLHSVSYCLDAGIIWNAARDRVPALAADAQRALARLAAERAAGA
jgi:uncharacterized protein with HEPN domain